jgi:hypothetical protein
MYCQQTEASLEPTKEWLILALPLRTSATLLQMHLKPLPHPTYDHSEETDLKERADRPSKAYTRSHFNTTSCYNVRHTTLEMSAIKRVTTALFAATITFCSAGLAQPRFEYAGKQDQMYWYSTKYLGASPGAGVIAFQVMHTNMVARPVDSFPLFIKCKEGTFSAHYEPYKKIPAGHNIASMIQKKYC